MRQEQASSATMHQPPPTSKDQVASENSIPLSPQWLYAKPSDSKDIRQLITLPPGCSSDNKWRLDGPQDKKEQRRNIPDSECNRRWRDEERDTGLLGRRERRKEGDREAEQRKGDRRSDSNSREAADSRALPSSERWHEVTSRNSGHEGRRDGKWSSRWGPEDKDRELRIERKTDTDKVDQLAERPSLSSTNHSLAGSDSRDKWRPRHRQEVHFRGSSVYLAAPGFGLERGRAEGSTVGFAPGRGRANIVDGLRFSRASSTGPIGAALTSKKYGSCPDTFCYPRGKLLDIYRKKKMLPHFDKNPAGLEDVPPITQVNSTSPFAFVTPGAEEEAVLEDISKGSITRSEASNITSSEKVAGVDVSADVGEKDLDPLDSSTKVNPEEVTKVNPAINGMDSSSTVAIISDCDGFSSKSMLNNISNNSELLDVRKIVVNDERGKFEGTNLNACFDDTIKLPDDSSSLFAAPSIHDVPNNGGQYQTNNKVSKLAEPIISPEELTLLYRDPQGDIQGSFLGVDIIQWFEEGFFGIDLPVCLSDAPEGTPFQPLGELIPQLKSNFDFTPEQSEPTHTVKGNNMEASKAGSDFPAAARSGHHWTPSGLEGPLDPHVEGRDSTDAHYESLPFSNSDNSASFSATGNQCLDDFPRQEAEVTYTGKPASDSDNPLGKLATDRRYLSDNPSGHYFSGREEQPNLASRITDNDLNPLKLLWSELEGTHSTQPLSSKLASTGDHGQISSAVGVGVGDASLFTQEHEQFNVVGDTPIIQETWPSNYRRNTSFNVLQDAMDASHFEQFEQDVDRSNLEEYLLQQQQLQKQQQQQLQQQHLLSHKNMHMTVPFLEQLQGALERQHSMNQPMPDLERHLLKLQLQEYHLQQLQQQQLQQQRQHQQQQIRHQMRLMQQQRQEEEEQLLFEHLMQQQIHGNGMGATHVDQVLFRQFLHELQQQAHHIPQHCEPYIEQLIQAKFGHDLHPEHHKELLQHQVLLQLQKDQLSMHRGPLLPAEQQLILGLQQEQLQAQQFSLASRQQLAMDDEREPGVWSVDESGQFIRRTASPHQSRSARPNLLDFPQSLQRPSFEQPSHIERHFRFHEGNQRENFGGDSQPFEMTASFSAGTLGTNVEIRNALARLERLDVQQQHGQIHPSGHQREQIPSSLASHQHHAPNQFSPSHFAEMESHCSGHNGQFHGSLIESQINQLYFDVEKQKLDMKMNLSGRESNSWKSLVGNDEVMKPLLQHNLVLQSSQSLNLGDSAPTSYDYRDPAQLFSHPISDHPLADSIDPSLYNTVGQIQQDRLMNTNMEIFENSARLSSRFNSGALFEHKQLFPVSDDIEKEQFAASIVANASVDRMDLLDMEGKTIKKHGSKGKINRIVLDFVESGIEQTIGPAMDHGDLEVNAPISHASFGSSGGGINFYNSDMGVDNAYSGDIINNRVTGILSRGADISAIKTPSPGASTSEEGRRKDFFENTSAPTRNERRYRGASSASDAPEASSFVDMLKSTKKPEASAEAHDAGGRGGSSKKKGKKGRQIDPSLLGFKVHSNRIMMGQIHRPDDL